MRLELTKIAFLLPEMALENLALDPYIEVRLALATSNFSSEKMGNILAKDLNQKVQRTLQERVSLLKHLGID